MTYSVQLRLKVLGILTVPFLMLASASTQPIGHLHKVIADGSTHLSLGHPNVQVTLQTAKVPNDFFYKNALFWGAETGFLPPNLVRALRVREDSQELFVPLSAYSDLGDIHRASLRPSPHGFILSLYGGETATGYVAALRFANGYLVSRAVSSDEFPQSAREETRYSFPKGN